MPVKRINQSLVLSVSLRENCYRYIRVSANLFLDQLADLILQVFHFENDHSHSFHINNRTWTSNDLCYMDGTEPDDLYRHTFDYRISQLGLKEDEPFQFLFDPINRWEFQCIVLRIEDIDTKEPELIHVVGRAPRQYPIIMRRHKVRLFPRRHKSCHPKKVKQELADLIERSADNA